MDKISNGPTKKEGQLIDCNDKDSHPNSPLPAGDVYVPKGSLAPVSNPTPRNKKQTPAKPDPSKTQSSKAQIPKVNIQTAAPKTPVPPSSGETRSQISENIVTSSGKWSRKKVKVIDTQTRTAKVRLANPGTASRYKPLKENYVTVESKIKCPLSDVPIG